MNLIKCPNCGKEINNANNFCSYCGHNIQANILNNNSKHDNTLIIRPNENKLNISIIGLIIPIILFTYLLFTDINIDIPIIEFVLRLVYLFLIVFIGYTAIFAIKIKLENKPILVVDKTGITDNSTTTSVGFIPWKDINNIYIKSFIKRDFIIIDLKNEEQYLNKLSAWKKLELSMNKKKGYGTVCINLRTD